MSKRYKVGYWAYTKDSALKTIRKDTTSRITIDDTHNDNQIVVTFPIQVCKKGLGYNPEYYGVDYNDERLAARMAKMLCDQMNMESGYLVRKNKEKF